MFDVKKISRRNKKGQLPSELALKVEFFRISFSSVFALN